MWRGNRRIYLDYASSTLPLPKAISAIHEAEKLIGNPGAIHAEAVAAKAMLEKARDGVARQLSCKSREVIFTSGLTESINLAILGFARRLQIKDELENTHWIVSSIEHSAVLECFAEIERLGGLVTHVDPNERGIFSVETVVQAIRPETVFVSIGWANNEIGVVQPIRNISRAVKDKNPKVIFHSDAGQAPLYLSPQVHSLGVDLLSLGSNKLYGPHGVGALYVGKNVELAPIVLGGGQERALRAGTESVALAAGFAAAFDCVTAEREAEAKRLRKMRDELAHKLSMYIPGMYINGDLEHALPHMLNISIPGERSGEYLVLQLDHAGVSLSTKSACRESEASSHVVAALGGEEWRARNTLRFSLGRDTSEGDLKRTAKTLTQLYTAR